MQAQMARMAGGRATTTASSAMIASVDQAIVWMDSSPERTLIEVEEWYTLRR